MKTLQQHRNSYYEIFNYWNNYINNSIGTTMTKTKQNNIIKPKPYTAMYQTTGMNFDIVPIDVELTTNEVWADTLKYKSLERQNNFKRIIGEEQIVIIEDASEDLYNPNEKPGSILLSVGGNYNYTSYIDNINNAINGDWWIIDGNEMVLRTYSYVKIR